MAFGQRARPMDAATAERLLARKQVPLTTLRRILYRAPEPYKARAWRKLLKADTPEHFRGILYSATAEYRRKAADRMITAGCGYETIFIHAPRVNRVRLARKLIQENERDPRLLRCMLIYAPEPYRWGAWERLLELPREKSGTLDIMRNLLERRGLPLRYRRAISEVLLHGKSLDDWLVVLRSGPEPQQGQAALRVVVEHPQSAVLVIRYCRDPQLREQAWRKLIADGPTLNVLHKLQDFVCGVPQLMDPGFDEYRDRAIDMLMTYGSQEQRESVVGHTEEHHRHCAWVSRVLDGQPSLEILEYALVSMHGDEDLRRRAWSMLELRWQTMEQLIRPIYHFLHLADRAPVVYREALVGYAQRAIAWVLDHPAQFSDFGTLEQNLLDVLQWPSVHLEQWSRAATLLLAGGPSQSALLYISRSGIIPFDAQARTKLTEKSAVRRSCSS
ncbi:hypothetical protein HYV74_04180 [Candidatus Uhrbacteria bacterium]|nr:hypothetical protein [Candidatus Uhrbacteria bacterium]